MDISQEIGVFLAGGGVVSFIWHCGMYVGKLKNEVSRHSDTLSLHDKRLERHEDEIRELRG